MFFDALGRLALGQVPSASASALSANAGTFTLTGIDAVFAVTMPAEVGAFAHTGIDAGLVVSMTAETGAFVLTGQAALTPAAYVLACNPFLAQQPTQFGFAALGAVALGQGYVDTASSITYQVAGGELSFAYTMAAEAGSFAFTGNDVALFLGNIMSPEAGAYAVAFQPFATALTLPMATGSFVLGGFTSSDLVRRSPKIRRFPRVGSSTATARSRGAGVKVRAYGG